MSAGDKRKRIYFGFLWLLVIFNSTIVRLFYQQFIEEIWFKTCTDEIDSYKIPLRDSTLGPEFRINVTTAGCLHSKAIFVVSILM
jgi:hypothetical protein